jgi:hypothetical protein
VLKNQFHLQENRTALLVQNNSHKFVFHVVERVKYSTVKINKKLNVINVKDMAINYNVTNVMEQDLFLETLFNKYILRKELMIKVF